MSQRGGYVLKFISGKYQGGEFPLEMDAEIVIGRSSELDMVLVEDMVSRRHARITSFNKEIAIEDFGSTNGTFVNGERITKTRLKEGDRILVGTNIIKLVHRDDIDASNDMGAPPIGQGGMNGGTTNPPGGARNTSQTITGTITGLIDEVPLPDLLQLFSTSKKSGVLVILSDDTGKVYLRDGRVFFSTINDNLEMSPYKAFYRMMGWKKGTFSLEHPTNETFENEINESVEGLMMEGMRQLDEIQNLGTDVPDLDAYLVINKPLVPLLSSLKPEHLDTFQLALNYGKISEVLNKSENSDLDTMKDVLHLVRNDFVRVN
ncbi:MAG: FHA domain-containing protein [Myxococcota bacterium]|nr:FHA domain-containing protein [Myxococcota bacterium]MEC9440812.1 FHA domain-containing protein [Myxococcota bacterium]